jgi:hypothetical protein
MTASALRADDRLRFDVKSTDHDVTQEQPDQALERGCGEEMKSDTCGIKVSAKLQQRLLNHREASPEPHAEQAHF